MLIKKYLLKYNIKKKNIKILGTLNPIIISKKNVKFNYITQYLPKKILKNQKRKENFKSFYIYRTYKIVTKN